MKIVVIGGTGLIGSRVVERLRRAGHEVLAASPASGVDTMTGQGLQAALHDAGIVVDLANSRSFEAEDAMRFFTTAGNNLLRAGREAGVRHHVALSVVGTARLRESGYFRAKQAQEELILGSGLPHTIVQATQFFEFLDGIAADATVQGSVRLPPAGIQPIAADDVAALVADAALAAPANGRVEIAGPGRFALDALIRQYLQAGGDDRPVVTDVEARYFGIRLDDGQLLPAAPAALGTLTLEDWLARAARAA